MSTGNKIMRSPCLSCTLRDMDKNNDTCMNCRARIDYSNTIAGETHRLIAAPDVHVPTHICYYCGETKPIDEFRQSSNGASNTCKQCDEKRRNQHLTFEGTKRCSQCGEEKPMHEFHIAYGKPRSYCKECNKKYLKDYRKKHKKEVTIMDTETKTCTTCGQKKALDDFIKNRNQCRECKNAASRRYEAKKREKLANALPETKKCKTCGKDLPFDAFYSTTDGYKARCKECIKNASKKQSVPKQKQLNHNESMSIEPPKSESRLVVDFSGYPVLMDRIKNQAEEELREPNNMVIWAVKQYLRAA